jgi:hypothetical protein
MPRRRHSDELFEFSHSLFKIEYKITKLVFFALSLYGLYGLLSEHIHLPLSPVATPSASALTDSSRPAIGPPQEPRSHSCEAFPEKSRARGDLGPARPGRH